LILVDFLKTKNNQNRQKNIILKNIKITAIILNKRYSCAFLKFLNLFK